MKSKQFYKERYHPQYKLSKANIRLYNTILNLDVNTIFEFGCGIGRHLHRLEGMGYNCFGVDISKDCIREAKQHGLNVKVGDETSLSKFKPRDLVFTNSVLCHIENIDEALKNLKALSSKYLLMFECINKEGEHWYIHNYPGKEILTIDSHLEEGRTYKLFLCEF